MTIATGRAPTAHGAKYLTQLCKHWSHKLQVELAEGRGVVHFPSATATLEADEEGLTVRLDVADAAEIERFKDVVAQHLDRFAFREAPLAFSWA